jgi:hypothetical protein
MYPKQPYFFRENADEPVDLDHDSPHWGFWNCSSKSPIPNCVVLWWGYSLLLDIVSKTWLETIVKL